MASQKTAHGKVEAFEGAVFAEGFKGILGTCGGEAAAGLLERGDADLVEAYQEDEGRYRYFFYEFKNIAHVVGDPKSSLG